MPYIKEYTNLNPQERRQLFYKRKFKEENPDWDDSMIKLKNIFEQQVKGGARVLDFGCGHGNFVIDELKHKKFYAEGLDVGAEDVKKNICLSKVTLAKPDESFPFADQTFDAVISLWALEHLENPKKAFWEIHRILKPEGIFAFVIPNKQSLLITLRRLVNQRLAHILLSRLYGRKEHETFGVFYRANTISDLRQLATTRGFSAKILETNPDPSYTSFGKLTYRVSAWLAKSNRALFNPHIIGAIKKDS